MNPESTGRTSPLASAVFSIALVMGIGLLLSYKACSRAFTIAENFQSGNITRTFRSNLEKVTSTHGNILELAVSESDEMFRQRDERKFGWLYLGTTEAEISARCTFRYHVQLSDEWNLDVRSNICLVKAPAFRSSLPVAINTDTVNKRAESGWARFDKHDMMDALESAMSRELAKRSTDPQHMGYVREECRRSVAEFVKNWLLREDHWRKDRFSSIVVVFPDEIGREAVVTEANVRPVINLIE